MFNPNAIPESKDQGFTLLPKGGYRVIIADVQFKFKVSDLTQQEKSAGVSPIKTSWFNVRFDILPYHGAGDYEFAGRRIYNNYTWDNQNVAAREIGHGQLSDLMFAANAFVAIGSPSELPPLLMNKELYIDVYHAKRKDTGADETRIGGYWTTDGKQRKKSPKPIPVPPTAQAIAQAPAQAPKQKPAYGSGDHGHPAFDDVPF